MTTLPEGKLDTLLIRHSVVEAELSRQLPPEQFVKLSREFAEIDQVVAKIIRTGIAHRATRTSGAAYR